MHHDGAVPLPLRPSPPQARDGGADTPPLPAAEHDALAVIAEQVRARTRLEQLWLFVSDEGGPVVQLAHAAAGAHLPDAAARDAAADALRAAPHTGAPRFRRGLSVVRGDAGGGRAILVVAASPSGAPLAGAARAALVELTGIAARVLAAPAPAGPRELAKPEPAASGAYGAGLADALKRLRRPPLAAESRTRLERALDQRYAAIGAGIRAIETDVSLALAVMGAANELPGRPRGGFCGVPAALDALGARAVLRLAASLPELHPLEQGDRLAAALRRTGPHAIATRAAADLVARHAAEPGRDQIRLAAALHDLGKVVLASAGEEYLKALAVGGGTPEERLADERRRMGIDHASIGAVAAARLRLPKSLALAIEHHHDERATGIAGIVRFADMLAHHAAGEAVRAQALLAAGRRYELGADDIERLVYDLPRGREPGDSRAEPSPLTPMQEKVLEGLAAAKTYKQIAATLDISESTVRTHLHNLYAKLEVTDRAQAVLLSAERGWI